MKSPVPTAPHRFLPDFRFATFGLVLLTLAGVGLHLGCSRPGTNGGASAGAGGSAGILTPMPEFKLASLGGDTFTKADFAGRVVLFDFWATWCGPCHLQADVLRDLYPDAAKKGFEFVAVATGEEVGVVRDFVSRKPFPYAVFVDPEETVGAPLEINALPTLLIMDAQGRIAYRHTGVTDAAAILSALDAAASRT
ncbi:MAG: TlpA disulfide reductase family protein [Thermoanaerobaculia bacterium]